MLAVDNSLASARAVNGAPLPTTTITTTTTHPPTHTRPANTGADREQCNYNHVFSAARDLLEDGDEVFVVTAVPVMLSTAAQSNHQRGR